MTPAYARGGAPEPSEAPALPQHQLAPETSPTAILARARAILGDMTTGEADAWRRGYAAGERQAMEVLLPMLERARAELSAAVVDLAVARGELAVARAELAAARGEAPTAPGQPPE